VPLEIIKRRKDIVMFNIKGRLGLFFLLLACCVVSLNCGYTVKSALPSGYRSIYVEPFKNSINFTSEGGRRLYMPLLEVKIRDAIVNRFLFDGNLKVAGRYNSDLILSGELKGYNRSVLRYTDDEDAEEYRVSIIVSLRLMDAETGKVVWEEPSFAGEADYFVSGAFAESEDTAIDNAVVDLARRVVERTIENW